MTERKAVERRRYTTRAINTGGRNGESRLLDGSLSFKAAMPKEMGGSGDGVNPEQLFAMGWAACYHSALERHKGDAGIDAPSKVAVEIGLNTDPEFGGFKLVASIEVGIDGIALDTVQTLADKAHGDCAYSKATRGNIDVTVHVTEPHFIEDVE